MLLPRLSSLLCLAGLAAVPAASAYRDDPDVKSIPVRTVALGYCPDYEPVC